MITSSLKYIDLYKKLHHNLAAAIDYIHQTDFMQMSPGRYEIAGEDIFSIVNEYAGRLHSKAFHMDLYRLKNIEEAEAIGLYEYFDSGQYCFVEWPEIIEDYQKGITLNFDIVDTQTRKLTISN